MISAHYLLTLVSIQLAVIQVVTFWYYSRPPKSDILTFFNFKGIFKSFLWLRKIWNFSFLRDEVVWHNCGRIKISEIANMLCLLDQTCEEGGTTATKLCYAWRVKTRVLLQSGFWKSHIKHGIVKLSTAHQNTLSFWKMAQVCLQVESFPSSYTHRNYLTLCIFSNEIVLGL